MYSSFVTNSNNLVKIKDPNINNNNIDDYKANKMKIDMNLVDLSSRTDSSIPMTEDSSQPLLESTANAKNADTGTQQLLSSEPFLCGLPLNNFDRFVSTDYQ